MMRPSKACLATVTCAIWICACGTLSNVPWPDGAPHASDATSDGGHDATLDSADGGSEVSTDTATPAGGDGAGSNPDVGSTAPTGKWLSPQPNTVVGLGQPVTLTAQVASPYLAATDLFLSATLTTGPVPAKPQLKAGADGKVTFTVSTLPAGPVTLVLLVMDGSNPATLVPLPLFIDSPPGAPQVVILPKDPTSGVDLIAKVTAPGQDVDPGQEVTQTYQYQWTADDLPTDVSTATVPAVKTQPGQLWTVRVRAFDGVNLGPIGLATTTVLDLPPVGPTVAVQPAQPSVAATLTCAFDATPTDGDGQGLTYKISWLRNGKPWPEGGAKVVLPLAHKLAGQWKPLLAVGVGDLIACAVEVSDGTNSVPPAVSATVALGAFDACAEGGSGCGLFADCTLTQTVTPKCSCPNGFSGDGMACVDVNECLNQPCTTGAVCTNQVGTFSCACDSGWTDLAKVATTACADVDECAVGNFACPQGAMCINAPGSYSCKCKPGWAGDGSACKDIDQCLTGDLVCDPHATCINLPGPDTCTCDLGWAATFTTGGAAACIDLNECATPTAAGLPACVTGAICNNFSGGYDCTCGPGWQGDGKTCANVDECTAGLFACSAVATCQDLDGDYMCVCGKGYVGDGKLCDDVDECALGTAGCDTKANCTNKPGGFDCACKPGFSGDGKTCKAVLE